MSRLSVVAVGLIGAAAIACGPSGRGPEAPSAASASELVPVEEQALAAAVAQKRAGDPVGAWKRLEDLPASSPARFDPRYTEVMSAWADTRTSELGVEIAGSKGGGPAVGSVEADDPPHALSTDKIEGIVASKRSRLRDACFGEGTKATSFVLDLKIDTEGKVLEAKTSAVKGESMVAECVQSHAQSWTFPKNLEGAAHKTKFIFAR
jgi:hypothetical protein